MEIRYLLRPYGSKKTNFLGCGMQTVCKGNYYHIIMTVAEMKLTSLSSPFSKSNLVAFILTWNFTSVPFCFVSQVQMEELRQHMGATLSERYTSQQRGTAKIMSEHEQMRKDLAKVSNSCVLEHNAIPYRVWQG